MAKKQAEKSPVAEARRYPAVLRVTNEIRDLIKEAASSEKTTVSRYTCDVMEARAEYDLMVKAKSRIKENKK